MTATIIAVPSTAGYHDGRVQIGHAATTGQPVDYTARTERRACNGLILGGTGSGTTTLARHIADTLRATDAWLVRHADAAGRGRGDELDLLTEAERRAARPGRRREPLHLLIWDGLARLATDPALRAAHFVERVTSLARYGPEYGVAQLVIADPGWLRADVDPGGRLREVLSDNVIALRTRCAEYQLGGYPIAPTRLPRQRGHALVLIPEDRVTDASTDPRPGCDLVHTHLDLGRHRSDCPPCSTSAGAPLGDTAAPDPAGTLHLRDGATQ
jgi:hypothetical protein